MKCCFSPLSKNLKLDIVSISILEKHNLRVDATAAESAMHNTHTITTSNTSTIFQFEYNHFDQTPEISATGASMPSSEWSLSLPVQLPESFSLASQSVSTRVIQVTHDMVIQAKFHNTKTHTAMTVRNHFFGTGLDQVTNHAPDRGENPFFNLHDPRRHRRGWDYPRKTY